MLVTVKQKFGLEQGYHFPSLRLSMSVGGQMFGEAAAAEFRLLSLSLWLEWRTQNWELVARFGAVRAALSLPLTF